MAYQLSLTSMWEARQIDDLIPCTQRRGGFDRTDVFINAVPYLYYFLEMKKYVPCGVYAALFPMELSIYKFSELCVVFRHQLPNWGSHQNHPGLVVHAKSMS
jgi:hypothetical protein